MAKFPGTPGGPQAGVQPKPVPQLTHLRPSKVKTLEKDASAAPAVLAAKDPAQGSNTPAPPAPQVNTVTPGPGLQVVPGANGRPAKVQRVKPVPDPNRLKGPAKVKWAKDVAAQMGVDPVTFMLTLVQNDVIEVTHVNDLNQVVMDVDGVTPLKVAVKVPLDMRLDAAKAVAPYIHPRLQATQVSGPNDGPIQTAQVQIPTDAILKDKRLSHALSDLALLMAESPDEVN